MAVHSHEQVSAPLAGRPVPLRLVPTQRSALRLQRASQRTRVVIEGIPFDALTETQVVEHVLMALGEGEGGSIITPNVDILRQTRSPELRELVAGAELIVPDGMPIVWASRLQQRALPERVTGSSLIWSLSRGASTAGRSVYLLGGAEGIAQRAGHRLQQELPELRVAGSHCPPFGFEKDPDQLADVIAAVVAAKPDLVFVALGFPKQEKLMLLLRKHLPDAWLIGCGGTLTMVAGAVPRAPMWLQNSGMEWAHRLAMEPRRMARRYIVDGIPFATALMLRAAKQRGVTVSSRG